MIGLIYLVLLLVYLGMSICLTYLAYRYTAVRYSKGWVGGWLAALTMYSLVFWDWIPTYVVHKYYCSTQAGFWVYKSPDQWIKENPDMVGRKWGDDFMVRVESISADSWRVWYSDAIYRETVQQSDYAGGLLKRTEGVLIDSRNKSVLSRVVQFQKINESAVSLGSARIRDFKIWLAVGGNDCISPSGHNYKALDFQNLKYLFSLGRGDGSPSEY
ncbi:hypothetical protein [Atopomonas hussainii]|uniref:hypothetical protein n=1 Tax=Atopomonas hussainii TaxID=1429083 RepID=UPI000B13DF7C|nr:hypothetical protein [Atopomonas hussainii]